MADHRASDRDAPPAKRRSRTRRTPLEVKASLAGRGIFTVPALNGALQYQCSSCDRLFQCKFKAEKHKCDDMAITTPAMHSDALCNVLLENPCQQIPSDHHPLLHDPPGETPYLENHLEKPHAWRNPLAGQPVYHQATSDGHPLLSVDADLVPPFTITCTEDAAAFASEAWGAAMNGEVPPDVQAVHATTAAAMAEYQVKLCRMQVHVYMYTGIHICTTSITLRPARRQYLTSIHGG